MAYQIVLNGRNAEIRLVGELTFLQHRKFRTVIANLEQSDLHQVTLDLSQVDYIDAAGLGLLLVTRDTVKDRGGQVDLRGARGQVNRLLEVAKFTTLFQAA